MTSVGEILRSAREAQGRSVAEIAEELCITRRYLNALERDDLSNLPGTFFYKSFVRQYAAILDVPLKKLQPGIDLLTQPPDQPPAPVEEPLLELTVPPGNAIRPLDPLVEASNRYFSTGKIGLPMAALAVALLACTGFYKWWSQPPRQARTQAQAAKSQSNATASRVEVSATQDPNDANHVVLNLAATEQVWLSITNSEGKQIFSGVLQPSQTKTLTAAAAAEMKVGNAGGIEVRLNGKDIGPLGGRGQVKTILFTPDKFEIVEPPAPPDAAAL